jgi:molecular chaperone HtpG
MYALLFVPSHSERGLLSPRREEGIKLYSRKILIQEYCKDLLPEYLRFVDGVVDSEDLPLNVSRESIQANKVMAQLKKLVTSKVIDSLKDLARDKPEAYGEFWETFGRAIKQGVAIEQNTPEMLYPLLRFHTTSHVNEWSSLDDYVQRMKAGQKDIYYIMGDDERSVVHSPHLDLMRRYEYEVLLFTDPLDAFMMVKLNNYQEHPLTNVANAELEVPKREETGEENTPSLTEQENSALIESFKAQLGDRVADVRWTDRLTDSPARLVDAQGAPNQEMQRVYRLLNKDFDIPKKVLELNSKHPIVHRLGTLPPADPRSALIVDQIYENALLIEGLHPDPASMISRIQRLIEAALESGG